MRWLVVGFAIFLACAAETIKYKKVPQIKIDHLPFENDHTGFYTDEFLYQLGNGNGEAIELARNDVFQQKYAFRVIVAAIEARQEELIKKYFPETSKEIMDSIKTDCASKILWKKVKVACSTADLDGVMKFFKKSKKVFTLDEILQYDFKGTSSILHESIRHNNLVLLRDCLGFDDFNVYHSSLPSADPNVLAEHPFIEGFIVTPLMLAISLGYTDAAELLLKHPQTDQSKAEDLNTDSKVVASVLPDERKFKMKNLFKRYPFKKDLTCCEGDNFAMSILNGRSRECLHAHIWNLEEDVSEAVLIAAVVKSDLRTLENLAQLKKVNFKQLNKATKSQLFEAVAYLGDDHKIDHMMDFLHRVGFTFDMDDSNEYWYQELQHEYYPSIMELILTQTVPFNVMWSLLAKRLISEENAELMLTWALGRHDVDMVSLLTYAYPKVVIKYKDPFSSERFIHLIIKKFYPVTRDLEVISEILEAGVKAETLSGNKGEERTFWVEKTVKVIPDEPNILTKFARLFTSHSSGKKFSVSARKEVASELFSRTIVADLAGAKDFDSELVKLVKPYISEKGQIEIDKFKDKFKFEVDTEDDRENGYFAQASAKTLSLNSDYLENYFLQGIFNRSLDISTLKSICERIKDFYLIGPEGYSPIHILVSPKATASLALRVELLEILNGRKLYVNHLAQVGESVEGFDENGVKCTKVCKNWTPLMMAVFRREWDLVKTLMKRKADPLFTAPNGYNCSRTLLKYLDESK